MDYKLPPHNVQLEEGLLGCLISDPKGALSGFVSQHPRCRSYFYDIRNQDIFNAIINLQNDRQNVDVLTLSNKLKLENRLETVGGTVRLVSCMDSIPTPTNWPYYANQIRDYWIKRRLIEVGNVAVKEGYESPNASRSLDSVQREVLTIAQDNAGADDRSNLDLAKEYIDRLVEGVKNPDSLKGLLSGYADLDHYTNGLMPSTVTILAARPSMGKTSLALCIARNMAVDRGLPVGIFSLEMSAESLMARLIHMQAKVARNDYSFEMGKLSEAATILSECPIHIDDRAALSVQQIAAAARRMKQQHGIKAMFVDYLQLIRSTRDKGTRNDEVAEISSGLVAVAKELKVPVIVLSQLSRQVDKDNGRKPRLSDLRDSGAIEQDADQCWFIWRDSGIPPVGPGLPMFVSIEKNREGESGVNIPLVFFKNFTRFETGTFAKI